MQAERRLTATASLTQSGGPLRSQEAAGARIRSTVIELGKLAMSRQLSLTAECLLLMAHDLSDLPWSALEAAITGWRRGTLTMGRPEQMDRFPTVRQLRVQAELAVLEGW